MKLLIAIINDPDYVTDILDEFYQRGIRGATVMDTTGMAHIMAHQVPFFSRFAEFGEAPGKNKTIFAVVKTDEERNTVVEAIETIIGDLGESDTGIAITLPIDYCKGLGKIKGDE
ncbi:hypothetical protein [Isachenkonia alkalipeptolytica]|uniref:Nitrogen regulatory protein P-II n=1 Tax=Isachenkonia alkalipeptolytica TaxID=2565777 RepID=A0AA43XIS9_9CLOT|nr:hypothetical protein [Isachenkonia alkalipeptolytica]NBG87241.1 hypothetical protein [Isachenkonia alkalipeptolytica]